MRDLSREQPPRHVLEAADGPEPSAVPTPLDLREARRDRQLAHIAVMLLDTAKYLDPLVEMLSSKLLRWATLGAEVGLAFKALQAPSLERLEVLGVFTVLALWVLRKV